MALLARHLALHLLGKVELVPLAHLKLERPFAASLQRPRQLASVAAFADIVAVARVSFLVASWMVHSSSLATVPQLVVEVAESIHAEVLLEKSRWMSVCHFPFQVEVEEALVGELLLVVPLDWLGEVVANVQPESQGMVFHTKVEEPLCFLSCSWADTHLKTEEGLHHHLLLTYLVVEKTTGAMEDYL